MIALFRRSESDAIKEEVNSAASEWDGYFDALIRCLVDFDSDKRNAEAHIRMAAELADVCLEERQKRWTRRVTR